jgi:hypothetical protein
MKEVKVYEFISLSREQRFFQPNEQIEAVNRTKKWKWSVIVITAIISL